MVLYSKFLYGSQFWGEKKRFKNPILGCEDISKNPVLFFWDTLYLSPMATVIFLTKQNPAYYILPLDLTGYFYACFLFPLYDFVHPVGPCIAKRYFETYKSYDYMHCSI